MGDTSGSFVRRFHRLEGRIGPSSAWGRQQSKSRARPATTRAFFLESEWATDTSSLPSRSARAIPTRCADTISDAVLDACLEQDRFSRVACETYVKSNVVIIGGEITTKAKLDFAKIARDCIREIGYVNDDDVFHADRVFVNLAPHPAVGGYRPGRRRAQGRREEDGEARRRRPGPDVRLRQRRDPRADAARRSCSPHSPRPAAHEDSQAGQGRVAPPRRQVAGIGRLRERQARRHLQRRHLHAARRRRLSTRKIERFCIEEVVRKVLPAKMLTSETEFLINPTGRFVDRRASGRHRRSPAARSSSTATAAWAVTAAARSAARIRRRWIAARAYMGRWVAKNVVAAELASKCEVQFAYAIGTPTGVSVHVDTFGTGASVSDQKITHAISSVFSFQPARHHRAAEAAAPDLLEDDQLRALREERQGPDLGGDRQGDALLKAIKAAA